MIAKLDCQRLQHTYLIGNPNQDNPCIQLVMLNSWRVVLRYALMCIVVDINDDKTTVEKTIPLNQQSKCLISICSHDVSFVVCTEQEILVFGHGLQLIHSEKVIGEKEILQNTQWKLIFFPKSQMLFLSIAKDNGNSTMQAVQGPFSILNKPSTDLKTFTGHQFKKPIRIDDTSNLFCYNKVINTFEDEFVNNNVLIYDKDENNKSRILRGLYLLDGLNRSLHCYNYTKQPTFKVKSIIFERHGSVKRPIHTSRYLIDNLQFVDTNHGILGVTYLYDQRDYQSLLVILNYVTSNILQCFRTNFTTLQISPDYKLAYHKSGRGNNIKLTVRKLWHKQSLYVHLLNKSKELNRYGDVLIKNVLALLQEQV